MSRCTTPARCRSGLRHRGAAALACMLLVGAACSSSPEEAGPATPTPFPTVLPTEAPSVASEEPQSTESSAGESAPAETSPVPDIDAVPITLTTEDGETLSANVYGEGAVAVIMAHMRSRDQATWTEFAQRVAGEGHTAMTFDFRGYGQSSGTRDENLDLDLVAAIQHFTDQGASAIIVVGASMGGTAAVNVAAEWNLSGIITLSAPADFQGLQAAGVAANVGESALIIAAEDDQPFAQAAVDIDAAALTSQLILLSGSAHGTNLFAEQDPQLTTLMLEFIDSIT